MNVRLDDGDGARFAADGFLVLEKAVPPDLLAVLRAEAEAAVEAEEALLRAGGTISSEITRSGKRYYVAGRSRTRPALRPWAFGPLAEALCRSLLGPEAYLFIDVFITKMPGEEGMAWHQDFGYLDFYGFGHHEPNLSVWLALDDMTERNGALWALPFSQGGAREPRRHAPHGASDDKTADFGGAPGVLLPVPAGTAIVMSGLLPHRSGPNLGAAPRRAYLLQFSKRPILGPNGPVQLAVPFLCGGVRQEPVYFDARPAQAEPREPTGLAGPTGSTRRERP